jgi:uncharacterized membrane protein YgcG
MTVARVPRALLLGPRLAALAWLAAALLLPLPAAAGQAPTFAERLAGQHILDDARLITDDQERRLAQTLEDFQAETGVDLVVYTRQSQPVGTLGEAREQAAELIDEWAVGGENGLGAAMLLNVNPSGDAARVGVAVGSELALRLDGSEGLVVAVTQAVGPLIRDKEWDDAAANGIGIMTRRANAALGNPRATPTPTAATGTTPVPTPRPTRRPSSPSGRPDIGPAPPPGPPYPDPIADVRVYDYAEVLSDETIEQVAATIDAIEQRTAAQVVVYTQMKPESDTPDKAERDAAALIDQWGIGREGFDDGLVILYDLSDPCHGQVQLYAAPGYAAAFLSNAERQEIFEERMLPLLRGCELDGATLAAMERIDETATAEHARDLQLARQVDAAAGLVLAPLLLLGLVGWAGWSWLRFGRDPEYLDDASILMPAPPPGLSPAAAAVIVDGRANRHAFTTALVDLAARGEVAFRQPDEVSQNLEIDITVPDQRDTRLSRNRRTPLGPAETYLLEELRDLGGKRRKIDADDVPRVSGITDGFEERLEGLVAAQQWYTESPEDAVRRWSLRGGIVLVLGVAATFFGFQLPSNGLLLVGVALIVAAIAILIVARVMPQRTMEGARLYAQLAAYRRTLQKTLEQARTIDQVVASHALPWVETPDQAVLWAYALGLSEEVEEVLERSIEDVRTGAASPTRTYFPVWLATGPSGGSHISGAASRAATAGLFSGGVVPDFGSMTAALSSIGNPPASSGGGGGGGGGGFGGGGSGGGGGGAGGGF